MLIKIPASTKQLFTELEKATNELPSDDRNAFVLDLMKFCTDWQFAYLAFKGQNEE